MDVLDKIREAYRHCEELVRAGDKDQFLASLFAPPERRPYLFALYAFAHEIARVHMVVREPMAGTIRLQWWHEAIRGLPAEQAAASPIMIALQDAAHQATVSLEPLIAAVDARQAELQGSPPVGAAAAVFIMAARFLGVESNIVAAAADSAAQAVTFASEPQQTERASEAYRTFRSQIEDLPERALPAFLTVCLVPLRLKRPRAPQWRRQIALLRAAWLGFPKI
jgi:phytoene/squalene synthetase